MFKFISILLLSISFLLQACTGNLDKNMSKLDEIYGECDNPANSARYKKGSKRWENCKLRERSQGEGLFDLGGEINDLIGGNNKNVVFQNNVNPYLWKGSLEVTKKYPLKIADNQGGYIETDWIYTQGINDQRCLIKIQVLSSELITTGLSSSFLCENKINEIWVSDNKNYPNEEKQIILKILEIAGGLSKTS
tara:strand:+ start:241 stop:819 length:579 start_codon:yes stop_codon:yes gene_type:complete